MFHLSDFLLACENMWRKYVCPEIVRLIILMFFLNVLFWLSVSKLSEEGIINTTSGHESQEEKIHNNKNRNMEIINGTHRQKYNIAIGLAITSKSVKIVAASTIHDNFLFFNVLLASFCQTSSQGYIYNFYLAYDYNDTYFSLDDSKIHFRNTFDAMCKEKCTDKSEYEITLIECPHFGKPAWAQNDAMWYAYKQENDFYYRLNDDTRLDTPGWD